jgi:hypothetical protein
MFIPHSEENGIVSRACFSVFEWMASAKAQGIASAFTLSVTCVEIYRASLLDLLHDRQPVDHHLVNGVTEIGKFILNCFH